MQGKSSGRHWTELKKQGGPFLGRRGWLKQEAISLAPPQGNWKRALTRSNAWLITIVASGVSTMNVKYARVRQSETRILSWLHADDSVELLLANPQNKWTQAVLGWSNQSPISVRFTNIISRTDEILKSALLLTWRYSGAISTGWDLTNLRRYHDD